MKKMKEKNDAKISVAIILIIIIAIMAFFMYKFYDEKNGANDKTEANEKIGTNDKTEANDKIEDIENYDSYIGTWYDSNTENEITIKSVTDDQLTFTWFLYRLTGIDEDITVKFSNGEAVFYFEGYDDINFDGENTENEKYIRKATIKLEKNSVNVDVEDVKSIDKNDIVLNDPSLVYITCGKYIHSEKR